MTAEACLGCGSMLRHTRLPVPWGPKGIPCGDTWHDVDQLELDTAPYVAPTLVEGETLQERFESFHALNPWVYEALEKLTADWIAAGHARVGMKMMFEVLRWQVGRTTTGDEFKLNNSLTSRYARFIVNEHPEWETYFETRELKAA